MAANKGKTAGSGSPAKSRATSTKGAKNTKNISRWSKAWWRKNYVPVAFVLIFATIGGYLLYSTFAITSEMQLKMTLSSKSIDTNLCLDDKGLGTENHNPIISYGCNSSDNAQKWTLVSVNGGFQIKNTHANICVDDTGDGVGTNSNNRVYVVAWQCNAADKAQVWDWYGGSTYGQIKNHYNNGCINDTGSSRSAGTPLIVYPCTGTGPTFFAESAVSSRNGTCTKLTATQSANATNAKNAAHCLLSGYGWNNAAQFSCLSNVYDHESGWRYDAGSIYGSYGIPQANPGTKMSSAGSDWRTDATTQIKWGLGYIKGKYGTPCNTWNFWQRNHYY